MNHRPFSFLAQVPGSPQRDINLNTSEPFRVRIESAVCGQPNARSFCGYPDGKVLGKKRL